MAGMLPGVESARRRRCWLGSTVDSPTGSRRPSSSLYTSGNEIHLSANSMPRGNLSRGVMYGAPGEHIAREAKERLDEKLRSQRPLEIKSMKNIRNNKNGGVATGESSSAAILGNVQSLAFNWKKSSRKFSWIRKGWKEAEQDECAVCLEEFETGDALMQLRCAHRFHLSCVVPWLESNPHCPCCRVSISAHQ